MLTGEQIVKLRLLKQVVDFTLAAQDVLSEEEPQDPEPVDVVKWKISMRNRVLAGSGVKAKWLGTLSTKPEYSAMDLEGLGVTPKSAKLLADCRDELRATALALTQGQVDG